ncbi:MAG TPA: hypothetical protein DEQ65_00635 [Ruminococcaceae bacterium]|nr:hypothetical protein [Oscillospiraceae bacterium]
MKFYEKLNEYISALNCTAKDIARISGISAATLSRYRSGERAPETGSEVFSKLCSAIAEAAGEHGITDITEKSVADAFLSCEDFKTADKNRLCRNFSALAAALDINLAELCRHTNYDASTVFRFKNGTRRPSDPEKFADDAAQYISGIINTKEIAAVLYEVTGIKGGGRASLYADIKNWLLNSESPAESGRGVSDFLNKLDEFDLNKYIKAIHFDEMKVPSLPFQLPTSKYYYGISEMMQSELDFLKATVLSKSNGSVTLYSDMPMTEMAKDKEFPKKWMYGMALMLKKGLHLNNIHNIDRSFEEMMLGLESWIPMYMTGQISPYYLKRAPGGTFNHFLRVSGAAALSGEAIAGFHSNGRYYLSKTKEDIAYYQKRADDLLKNASPLMDIYREDSAQRLNAFLLTDSETAGNRRSVLSVPPVYTADNAYLEKLLAAHGISAEDISKILNFADRQREITEKILENGTVTDEIMLMSEEEFELHPAVLPLSGMFYGKDIRLAYGEYTALLKKTEEFAQTHKNYSAEFTRANPFRNLQIILHEGRWAMISKGNFPAIHFIIHHQRLRSAIESFTPPVVEE